jgi:multidrug efflux system outer membrane protein
MSLVRRIPTLFAATLFVGSVGAGSLTARTAHADDLDLEDDAAAKSQKPGRPEKKEPAVTKDDVLLSPGPIATIRPHAYTLGECLSLSERNHPNLWAARARLAFVHAQLDEARWTPYSYWSASARTGVLPTIGGTPFYNAVPRSRLSEGFGQDFQPFLSFGVSGTIPIYTFGKIDSIKRAAEAQVRYNEWDLEKSRIQVRADVRRAYFGLMLARDALYIADDILSKLNHAIDNVANKIAAGDTSVEEADRLRLEIYRDELLARVAEAKKGEAFASAALRFFTGVQTAFDIPDEPLKKPETPLGPVVRYLTAARLFRPDVNLARSGVMARRAQLDFARAQLYPNIGLGLGFSYAIAPSATSQNTAWIGDPFNGFGAAAVFGVEWGLDLLPKNARIAGAEAQLEEARSLERYALGGTAVEVENQYATAAEAKAREENWDRAEHRAKRWISSVQDGIDLGTKDERQIVEPLRAYVFARANHVQALMDFNVALSELARVTGWDAAAPSS